MNYAQASTSERLRQGRIVDFARGLVSKGYHILSTGGTAKLLAKEGVEVEEVADYTGFPEMLDGRVKTLNPKIHAGILARRPIPEHMAALKEHGIDPIDIVLRESLSV